MPYCTAPFWSFEVDAQGNTACCCPAWINFYSFGNIYNSTYEEIWNGKKMQKFRQNVLNNKYPHCNIQQCQGLDERTFREPDEDFQPAIKCQPPIL